MENLTKYFTNPDNVSDCTLIDKDYNSVGLTPDEFFDMKYQGNSHILFKHIICMDGYKVSIQAGYGFYCKPSKTQFSRDSFVYTHMELGFPNREDELINEYAECNDYTQTVYGQVPVELIEKLLVKHGGIKLT